VIGESQVEASPVGPVVRPADPGGLTVLYVHSDRYLSSAPQSALGLAECLAARTGAAVVCASHRHAFPAALDDVHDGYRYAQSSGPVVVAGEGLGAGLAAALLVRLRDAGQTLPPCAILVSGLLDLTMEAPSLLLNSAADPAFRVADFRQRAESYSADTPATDPLLSPLYANLHGLPPVQLLTAGNDVLVDDSLAFAARAARSGVTVDLRVHPDAAGLRAGLPEAIATFILAWTPAARPMLSSPFTAEPVSSTTPRNSCPSVSPRQPIPGG
jgi:epsilon-lactone hydrolase